MSTDPAPSTPTRKRLSVITKLAYGIGDIGAAVGASLNGFFLLPFLLDVAGIRGAWLSPVFLIGRVWDSINDPIIGYLSDNTHTRWGRRRPWLLFGAIPFGLTFVLLWYAPPFNELGRLIYFLVVSLIYYFSFTAVNLPYTALTPELTPDYNERTDLNTYRFSFSILSGIAAAALYVPIIAAFEDKIIGHLVMASIFGGITIVTSAIPFFFTKEPPHPAETEKQPGVWEGLRIAFSNRSFVLVTTIYLLSWLAIQFVQSNLFLYVKYWHNLEDQFTFLVIGVQLSAWVWVLIWNQVCQRIGKKPVYLLGMSFWVLVSFGLFFAPRGNLTILLTLAVLAGVGVAVGYLIPWSMLPDVVDEDELNTGIRREGVFYGLFVLLQQSGIGLALSASSLILDVFGYIPGNPPTQPDSAVLALRLFVSVVPVVILLLSFIAVYLYPITRQRHTEIRAELDARHATTP